MRKMISAAVAALAITMAAPAAATVTVTCTDNNAGYDCTPVSGQTIGSLGVDANLVGTSSLHSTFLDFDFTGSTLVITHPFDGGNIGFGGDTTTTAHDIVFTSSTPFDFASLVSTSVGGGIGVPNVIGFTANNVSLNDGALTIHLGGTTWEDRSVAVISLATPAAVPEPATWAMMLLGFGAIGFWTRRKRHLTSAYSPQVA
jgi:hypothetical protein